MLSISKNEKSLKSSIAKRLKIFEKITGREEFCEATRNLKVSGMNEALEFEDIERMFKEFGSLHVVDTQHLAQRVVIVSYFDIRNAKSAYNYFSLMFDVAFFPDPPFEEFSDILYIYVDPSLVHLISERLSEDAMFMNLTTNLLTFRYYDLRTNWKNQALLYAVKQLTGDMKAPISQMVYPKIEDKENLTPVFSLRKNPENLTRFVINLGLIGQDMDYRTTLMIKNIPNKYTQLMLLDSINKNHKYTFDFMYLPIDFKNKCNVGYAFINFIDHRYIPNFYKEFDGKKWEKFNSEKVCALSYARIQGRMNLEKHFQSSSIMGQDKAMRPVMLNSFNI